MNKTLHYFWAAFSLLLLSLFFTVTPARAQAVSSRAVNFAESRPVRELPAVKVAPGGNFKVRDIEEVREEKAAKARGQSEQAAEAAREINKKNREVTRKIDPNAKVTPDDALSSKKLGRNGRQPLLPNPPTVSFEGISIADTIAAGQGFLPPDTNGSVGPNHYVQTVNSCFRVWDKAGNPLTPVTPFSTLFAPLGSPCGGSNDGDPVVLYDQLADRWIISEFCTVATPNNHQIIAISKTGDPTGAYYLYDFMMPNNKFNDYPKFGVWPDAYYMTDNQFNQAGTAFLQGGVFAFNRTKMLVGDPSASFVYFDTAVLFPPGVGINGTDGIGGMLPGSLDGYTPPISGEPCPFAYYQANENAGEPGDQLRIFDFHVDFAVPANSTFTERTGSPLVVAAFDPVPIPNSRNVIPQPAPATAGSYVDAIMDRLMFRLAYRNFGTTKSLILNHTVNAATSPSYRAGVRWYRLDKATPAGAYTIAEQQTFAPADTENRWMGSGAMNFQGDIAVGYSVSSTTVFPSIRYAAKLGTDAPGSGLIQGEQTIIAGAGSQTHTSGRWGDYSSMSVDPSDDCSFWFTEEYYPVSSEPGNTTAPWHTRIAKVAPGPCAVSPRGTITGTITNCQSGLPIANAIVNITGGFSRATLANGTYSATVPPGTYTATATGTGYDTATSGSLVVSNGGSASFSACLNGNLKQPVADTANITADGCNSNGTIDPNETVTVSFGIKNTGTLNTNNLVGTLQATGGVTSPSAPQTYGVVVAGGATVFRSFTFTAGNIACGAPIIATMQLQDGPTDLGTITYNFATGVIVSSTYATGDIAVPLPDNTTVDIPLNVADVMTLSDVNASFRLNHTFDGDVVVKLVHPDGTIVSLVTNRGGSGANFGTGANNCSGTPTVIDDQATTAIAAGGAPFAGSFTPESPLSALNGKPSNGTWILRVSDTANLDTGTIGCFKLELNKHSVCCGALIVAVPPAVVIAESAFPANSAPDPGETVTVNLSLANTGLNNTTNLVATLQPTGGVTNPSGPQTYGVVVAAGPSVTRPFTFTASGSCGGVVTMTLALQDGPNNLGNVIFTKQLGTTSSNTQTFTNSTAIIIPATGTGATSGAPSNPYPSTIVVSGVPNPAQKVTVTFSNMNHTFPGDVDVLLVSPTGRKFIVMSDVIGDSDWTGQTYTFDDAAGTLLPSTGAAPATGTYKPTNIGTGDLFPAPAPASPYLTPATAGADTLTSAFTGVAGGDPNGTWSLYVTDDAGVDTGNFNGGWSISFTSSTPVCASPVTAASIKKHPAPAGTAYPVPMPLVGTKGIECRSDSGTNDYQLDVTFAASVTVTGVPQAQVTSGAGTVGSGGVANGGAVSIAGNVVTVPLTNVTNAQSINVTLFGVNSAGNVVVPMVFLIGDVNETSNVTGGDVNVAKAAIGPVSGTTFRSDINASGQVTGGDVNLIKAKVGTSFP